MNVWKCKLIFPTDTLQQNIEITDFQKNLAGENTSVLIILPTIFLINSSKKYVQFTRRVEFHKSQLFFFQL